MKKTVILLIALFIGIIALSQIHFADSKKPLKINVASFNVGFCRMAKDIPNWEGRRNYIMPLVKYHNFDIVGMQEPFSFQIDYLEKACPEYAVAGEILRDLSYADITKFSPKGIENVRRMCRNMNNPIFYKRNKFDLLEHGKFYFASDQNKAELGFGKSFDAIRSCIWAKFREKKTGKEFYFFNLHLCVRKFKQYHKPAMELLVKKIGEITKGNPFFITGDFNEFYSDEASTYLRELGIVNDARQVAKFRYGTHKGTYNDYTLKSTNDNPIDFIYASKNIVVNRFATITDHYDGIAISDHYPIVAEVEFLE